MKKVPLHPQKLSRILYVGETDSPNRSVLLTARLGLFLHFQANQMRESFRGGWGCGGRGSLSRKASPSPASNTVNIPYASVLAAGTRTQPELNSILPL